MTTNLTRTDGLRRVRAWGSVHVDSQDRHGDRPDDQGRDGPARHNRGALPEPGRGSDGAGSGRGRGAHAFLGLVRTGTVLTRDLSATLEARHGLSLHSFGVLLHLAVFSPGGTLRLGQLVAQAPLSQSRVSRLAQLDAEGLVTRTSATDDARGVDVAITEAGRALFRQAQEPTWQISTIACSRA